MRQSAAVIVARLYTGERMQISQNAPNVGYHYTLTDPG